MIRVRLFSHLHKREICLFVCLQGGNLLRQVSSSTRMCSRILQQRLRLQLPGWLDRCILRHRCVTRPPGPNPNPNWNVEYLIFRRIMTLNCKMKTRLQFFFGIFEFFGRTMTETCKMQSRLQFFLFLLTFWLCNF